MMISRNFILGVALTLGLGGSALAQGLGNGNSGSNTPPPGQVAPSGAGAVANGGSAQLFAVINADGTIARDKGVVSAARIGAYLGSYEVRFARNIKQCVYTATIGNAGPGNPSRGYIVVALRATTTDTVFVETRDFADALADRPFHLWVNC